MLDDFIENQKIAYKIFKNSKIKNHLGHAYLLEANGSSNVLDFALAFAKYILCPNNYTNNKDCGKCTQCMTINDNNYPDIKIIRPDGMWIKKEQLDELQKEFSIKSMSNNKKIYIITDASKLNTSSANSILKFLEEPEDDIIAILIVDNIYQVLNTIVSRCEIVNLKKNNYFNNELETDDLLKLKFGNILFNNNNDLEKFVEDENTILKIDAIVKFINYYEINHLKTLCHTNHLFFEQFKEKDDIDRAFELILTYYKDILNYKLKGNVDIYTKYIDKIEINAKNNSFVDLYHKLDIIMKLKEKIKINANTNLLIDKLIIMMEEGRTC